MEIVDTLKELGLDMAADTVKDKLETQRKLLIAYQNFQFVSTESVRKFNEELKKKTTVVVDSSGKVIEKIDPRAWQTVKYDKLTFTPLAQYKQVPPTEVLDKLRKAKELNCFDIFEVAKVESIEEVVDPIIFGVVGGCTDKFLVAQWDEDVKFEDIAKMGEKIDGIA